MSRSVMPDAASSASGLADGVSEVVWANGVRKGEFGPRGLYTVSTTAAPAADFARAE
jgi:hypothetical protein